MLTHNTSFLHIHFNRVLSGNIKGWKGLWQDPYKYPCHSHWCPYHSYLSFIRQDVLCPSMFLPKWMITRLKALNYLSCSFQYLLTYLILNLLCTNASTFCDIIIFGVDCFLGLLGNGERNRLLGGPSLSQVHIFSSNSSKTSKNGNLRSWKMPISTIKSIENP